MERLTMGDEAVLHAWSSPPKIRTGITQKGRTVVFLTAQRNDSQYFEVHDLLGSHDNQEDVVNRLLPRIDTFLRPDCNCHITPNPNPDIDTPLENVRCAYHQQMFPDRTKEPN
jgi:hypothetical protein